MCIGRHAKGIHNTLISLSPLSLSLSPMAGKPLGLYFSLHEYQIYFFSFLRSMVYEFLFIFEIFIRLIDFFLFQTKWGVGGRDDIGM